MDLDDLRAFARIADAGGVSAAARAAGTPKSSMSRSLARLEAAAGARLVERDARPLRLTEAGLLLLPHARRVLAAAEDAAAALEGVVGRPRGVLRVNAAVTYAMAVVAPMLPAFARAWPEIRIVLETENRIADLAAEEVDVAIRVGALPDSDLTARRLGRIELWCCASPAYLAGAGTPDAPSDLQRHLLVGWTEAPEAWRLVAPDGAEETVAVPPGHVLPEPAVMAAALAGGMGVGRLPDFLARPLIARGELVRLLPAHRPEGVDVHVLWPPHRSQSAKVRVFVDALVDHARSLQRSNDVR